MEVKNWKEIIPPDEEFENGESKDEEQEQDLEEQNQAMTWRDKKGNVYKISYTAELQAKIYKELRRSNAIKFGLMIAIVVAVVLFCLIFFQTGIVGMYLKRLVCVP